MKGRKPSAAGKLTALPPEQRELLIGWLVDENLSYADALSRVAIEFGVKTSVAALSNFYATQCFARRASEAQDFAESVVNAAEADHNLTEATLKMIRQRAFEHAHAKNGDLTALAVLAKIIGDSDRLKLQALKTEQDGRKLALDEARFRRETAELYLKWHEDKRARDIANGGGSKDAKIEALKSLFFAPGELDA